MSKTMDPIAFDRAAEPLLRLLTPDQLKRLILLSPDPALEARITELAERSKSDDLSAHLRAEYEGYIRANNLLAVLKGIATRRLDAMTTAK